MVWYIILVSELLTPERTARFALRDYMSVGAVPGFGELEVEALNEWINDCGAVKLGPEESAAQAWLYVERAYGFSMEHGGPGYVIPQASVDAIRADITQADNFFLRTIQTGHPLRAASATLARASLPTFRAILTGTSNAKAGVTFLSGQAKAASMALEYYRGAGGFRDVPALNTILGSMMLTATFALTDYAVLPSADRHAFAFGSSPYDCWHAAVHDCDQGKTYPVRFAVNGPPGYLVLPPPIFANTTFPTPHGRGTLEAAILSEESIQKRKFHPDAVITERQQKGYDHMQKVADLAELIIGDELGRVRGYKFAEQKIANIPPEQAVDWYRTLPPFADPCHRSHGGALDTAMSQLEMKYAEDALGPHEAYLLGWMHLESALSFEAQHAGNLNALLGSFDRAEDLLAQAAQEFAPGSAQAFEAYFASIAAPLYRAIATEDVGEAHIHTFCDAAADLLQAMLDQYDVLDKKSAEASELTRLIQEITVILLGTDTVAQSYIVLPSSPRQRRNHENTQRGWDFNIWTMSGEGAYIPGIFSGRISDISNNISVDYGTLSISEKALGQYKPAHNFGTSRLLLAKRQNPHDRYDGGQTKRLASAQRSVTNLLADAAV
ncbi:MAG TPA: hypothetical protein VLG11_00175 [Candidatus Saccharimonadales bacterium]|nr:hypothetical protein [Candidatus Saccharimonadales bacterium]